MREDNGVLSLAAFEQLRQEVCASGPPSDGDDLLGMELDFCAYLADHADADKDPGLWRDMVVYRQEGARWLITGRAEGRRQDAEAIGAELARIWCERLSYQSREGHTVDTAPDLVTLRAVTQIAENGLWVTALVRVGLD